MQTIKRFVGDFWPSMLTLAVIVYATLFPDPMGADELPPIPHIDKLIHAVMMGGLYGAIAFDMSRKRGCLPGSRMLWTLFACICAFGLVDEALQAIPQLGRGCDVIDLMADCTGALIARWLAPKAIARVLKLSD